jgi:hypothetical protein
MDLYTHAYIRTRVVDVCSAYDSTTMCMCVYDSMALYACMYVCTGVCAYGIVRMYVCVYLHTHIWHRKDVCMYVLTYTYTDYNRDSDNDVVHGAELRYSSSLMHQTCIFGIYVGTYTYV